MDVKLTKVDPQLLKHPFDEYQRYRDIQIAVDTIQADSPDTRLNVLDVGGTPATTKFLANYNVVVTNLEPDNQAVLQTSGTCLSLQDDSFDIVITADTVEHVPALDREAFIAELIRVSRRYTIITAPFSNGYNEFSETILNDFLIESLEIYHRFLLEHLENGLPDLDQCLQWISKRATHYVAIPSGYIHHWLPLMMLRYYFTGQPNGQFIAADIERFHNYQSYWGDHRLPSYRQLIVVSKKGQQAVLDKIENIFADSTESTEPDLSGVVALWQALRGSQILEEQGQEIERLRQENKDLHKLITGYKSGWVMRLMSAFHQIIGTSTK